MQYSKYNGNNSEKTPPYRKAENRISQDSLLQKNSQKGKTCVSGGHHSAVQWMIPIVLFSLSLMLFIAAMVSKKPGPAPMETLPQVLTASAHTLPSTVPVLESIPPEISQKSAASQAAEAPEELEYSEDLVLKNFSTSGTARRISGVNILKNQVTGIEFQNSLAHAPSGATDVSETGNGKVLLWCEPDGNGMYKLFIAGDGKVYFPEDSSFLFGGVYDSDYTSCYAALKKIQFGHCVDTSRVQNMTAMFQFCVQMEDVDLENFSTENVTDMSYMFCGCGGLKQLDLSSFRTDRVTNMSVMFSKCWSLEKLDLSNFSTENVMSMVWMFGYCNVLSSLNLGSFDTSAVHEMGCMFCNSNPNMTIITENQRIYGQFQSDMH